MKRIVCLVLLVPVVTLLTVGCGPQDVDDGRNEVTSPTPKPTPTDPPTPPPADLVVDYLITSMTVATSSKSAIDLDDDGTADYGFEKALSETVKFVVGRLDNVLNQLVAEGTIPEEAAMGLKAAAVAAFNSMLSVNTINAGLSTMLAREMWIQRLSGDDYGDVELGFYGGSDAGEGYYYAGDLKGDPFSGTYDDEDEIVDVYGGTMTISVPMASNGADGVAWDFVLEDCRNVEGFAPEALDGAILGGGISVSDIQSLAQNVLMVVGVLPFMSEEQMTDLQNDLDNMLRSMTDIELSNGEDAVSMCLTYDATMALIWE